MKADIYIMRHPNDLSYDLQTYAGEIYYWFLERIVNMIHHTTVFGLVRFVMFSAEFLFLLGFTQDGKISIFNPRIFGVIPLALMGFATIFQMFWNTWANRWWAKGNVFVIMDHFFALV